MAKRIILWIALLSMHQFATAQNVFIPDNDLIIYFNNAGFSGCLTGDSINLSCPAVENATKVNITGYEVSNIDVLAQFPNLDTLIAINCGIEAINLPFFYGLKYLNLSYNQISYYFSLPESLEYIDFSNNQLTEIPTLPFFLKYLNCRDNQITSLPNLPQLLTYLDCSYNQLSQFPVMNTALQHLNTSNNLLTSMPSLAINNLRRVWLNDNQITQLPALPDSLRYLNFSDNLISTVPFISASKLDTLLLSENQVSIAPSFAGAVNLLDFSNNLITTIPSFPSMTENCKIYASHNLITSISPLPSSLTHFYVSNNAGLSSLIPMPNSLIYLDCSYCNLSQLNALPPALSTLQCSKNPLIQGIGTLPLTLSNLYADSSQLTVLPDLPASLFRLQVKGNQLTELNNIPLGLRYLNASGNQLTTISSNSSEFSQFLVNNNPNLYCLPPILKFWGSQSSSNQFSIAETGISCLPNVIEYSFTSPMFDTLAPCGMFSNPNNCQIFWNIVGNVFLESNQDCIQNNDEPNLNSIKVMLKQGSEVIQQAFTNINGWYSFNTDLTEYLVVVDTLDTPFQPTCPIDNTIICNPGANGDTLLTGITFGLSCEPGFDLSAISMVHTGGLFFPMQIATLKYTCGDLASAYGATCNTAGVAGGVRFTLNGPGQFYDVVTETTLGDTLLMSFDDWGAVDYDLDRYLHVQTDMFPIPGDITTIQMEVFANAGNDVQLSNDTIRASYLVVNSYDPNYKEVYPSLIGEGGQWHFYTIHFQNTGTAPAFNIVVKDTLSPWLDWNTFKRLDASHYNVTQVFEDGEVHFNFPNIMLADSTSDPEGSQGWVQFKIKSVAPLPGAFLEIPNRASIYFDFNAPVNTEYCNIKYCLPMNRNQSITICAGDSFQVGSKWYHETGMYLDTLQNIYTCDSLILTSLYVRNSEIPDTVSLFECTGSPFNFDGNVYQNPGILTFNVPTSLSCDSILVLRMEWVDPGPLEEVVRLCGNDSFIVEGVTYYEPDTVTYLLNDQGCEYTLIYYLVQEEAIDVPIIASTNYLETSTGFEAYQWYNCATGNAINGANENQFFPNTGGTYSVAVTTATGCEFRSTCQTIEILSTNSPSEELLRVYPNPTHAQCLVQIPESIQASELIVIDPTGRQVMVQQIAGMSTINLDLSNLAVGIYWIQTNAKGIASRPVKLLIH
jgi:hypothetical protein